MWLATLKAYREFGKAAGDDSIVNEASQLLKTSHDEIIDKLWTGKFFAYGCEPDGSGCLDDTLFTGQLAGQFISRYCGWGDIYSMDKIKKSLDAQFRIPLSSTPDYYANKVWDIRQNKGVDWPQSQCWPFYLESYTAMAGIQAGSVDDGLEIMRHIQLVHLRHGWTWTQNLWNPSDITYMTAPVTWFSTDVLAGAGINIPEKELRLAPIVKSEKVVLPLFYPGFWATLTADPSSEALTLKITKTYKGAKAVFDKVIAEPAGVSADERRRIDIKPFKVREGAVLDLSKYYDEIVCPVIEKPVLQ